jgi:plasmid stability protein
MATLTIRNLPDKTQRALKRRAASNGRSMEAEARLILGDAIEKPTARAEEATLQATAPEPALTQYEKQNLTPTQQAALLSLRKVFAPKPGQPARSVVDEFLAERRAEAARE